MVRQVRMGGPLARYEEGFRARLDELGYASSSAGDQVRLFADLSGWLAREGLDAAGLDYEAVGRFLAARRAQGRRTHLTTRALGPLLDYLQELGVAPVASASPPTTAAAQLLETFRRYLVQERGLAPGTVGNYVDAARLFLALPYDWTRVDRLVTAVLEIPLRAYAGKGKPADASGDAAADRGTRWIPMTHTPVTQLYVPGLFIPRTTPTSAQHPPATSHSPTPPRSRWSTAAHCPDPHS